MSSPNISSNCNSCRVVSDEFKPSPSQKMNCEECLLQLARYDSSQKLRGHLMLLILVPFAIGFWVVFVMLIVRLFHFFGSATI